MQHKGRAHIVPRRPRAVTLLRPYIDIVRDSKRVWLLTTTGCEDSRIAERLPRRIIRWVEEVPLVPLPQFIVLLCQATRENGLLCLGGFLMLARAC
eukprot:COSAG06_NODE_42658_length_379_cov_1.485714_1_plen_95_part_10